MFRFRYDDIHFTVVMPYFMIMIEEYYTIISTAFYAHSFNIFNNKESEIRTDKNTFPSIVVYISLQLYFWVNGNWYSSCRGTSWTIESRTELRIILIYLRCNVRAFTCIHRLLKLSFIQNMPVYTFFLLPYSIFIYLFFGYTNSFCFIGQSVY